MRWLWLPMLALVLYVSVAAVVEGSYGVALAYGACGLVLTWWLSPFRGGRGSRSHADVVASTEADRSVVIYWRPGCPYCLRLRVALGRAGGRALWVNIWQDSDGAAYVRNVNNGDETVPTVVIDGVPHTNPDPSLVRERLAA